MTKKKNIISIILCLALMVASAFVFPMAEKVSYAQVATVNTLEGDKVINKTWTMYPNNKTRVTPSSNAQKEYPLKNINDGNLNTFWHTQYGTTNPKTTITLQEARYVNGLMYATRHDNQYGGMINKYKILADIEGQEQEIASGSLDQHMGVFFIPFDRIVKTNKIIIDGSMNTCAELSVAYINYGALGNIIAQAQNMYNQVNPLMGSDEGQFLQEDVDILDGIIAQANKINTEGQESEKVEITAKLNESFLSMPYKVLKDSTNIHNKYNQVRTVLNAVPVGNQVLHMPEQNKSDFTKEMEGISLDIGHSQNIRSITIDENNQKLDSLSKKINAVIKQPVVNCYFDKDYQKDKSGQNKLNITALTDDSAETAWVYQYSNTNDFNRLVNPNNELVYFDYDYENEVRIDSMTIGSYWASNQSPTTMKVQAFDGEKYNDIEVLHFNLVNDSTKTIYQTKKFSKPFNATKIRVHLDGAKTGHGAVNIKKMGFGLIAEESAVKVVADQKTMVVKEGEKFRLAPTVLPFYLSNKNLIYISDDENLISMNNDGVGEVKVLPEGEKEKKVTITMKSELFPNKFDTCEVTVSQTAATEEMVHNALRKIELTELFLNGRVNKESFDQKLYAELKQYLSDSKLLIDEGNLAYSSVQKIFNTINEKIEAIKLTSTQNLIQTKALINRVTHNENACDKFEYAVIPAQNGHDVFGLDWNSQTSKPILKGNNIVSLSMAFNYYLEHYLYQQVPYIGDYEITLPTTMVEVAKPFLEEVLVDLRMMRNFTDGAYTYRFYDDKEVERIADWMALHGFNMALAFRANNDALIRLGMEIQGSPFTGSLSTNEIPGLQRIMYKPGNVPNGVGDKKSVVLDENLKDEDGNVLKDKDGHPLTPDGGSEFYGCIALAASRWQGVEPSRFYISPFVYKDGHILPDDNPEAIYASNSFDKIASKMTYEYLRKDLLEEYGYINKYYVGNLVNEAGIVVDNPAFPRDRIISKLQDSFLKFNPEGIWVHDGWRIEDWVSKQFKKGHFMVLDLECERDPKWNKTGEFNDNMWLYSIIHNFGGNNGLTGNLNQLAVDFSNNLKIAKNMKGLGYAPEAGEIDPLLVDFYSELMYTADEIIDISLPKDQQYAQADAYVDNWLKDYAKRRYGKDFYQDNSKAIDEFMLGLHDNLYCKFVQQGPSQTIVNAHPALNGPKARTWGTNERPYGNNISPLFTQWKNLVTIATNNKDKLSSQFRFDLIDYSRQVMADFSMEIFNRFKASYNKKDKVNTEKYLNQMINLCDDLDSLLGTNYYFTIARRVKMITDSQKENATKEIKWDKMKTTIFDKETYNLDGNGLNDYANRHWAGLMDFYKGRWVIFKNAIMTSLNGGAEYNQRNVNNAIKNQSFAWVDAPYDEKWLTYTEKNNDVDVANQMYNKYVSLYLETDKTSLQAKYDELNDTDLTGYTQESIKEFKKILADVKVILDKQDATKQEIDNALTSLNSSLDSLVIDKTSLQEKYDEIKDTDLTGYTEQSVQAFNQILTTVKTVLDNDDATKQEIDNALTSLNGAIDDLVVDKTSLQAKYDSVKDKNLTGYSADSVTAFNNALANAKTVLESDSATVQEVSDALTSLNTAIDGLVIDKTSLQAKYDELKDADLTGYTQESINEYNGVLIQVKAILDNDDATKQDIDSAMTSLENINVVLKADKTALKSKYDEYVGVDKSKYSDDSVKAFDNALVKAKEVLDDINATKQDINSALTALQDSYNSLATKKGCGGVVDSTSIIVCLLLMAVLSLLLIKKKAK